MNINYLGYGIIISIVLAIGAIAASSPQTEKTHEPEEISMNFPAEMKDCKTFRVYSSQPGFGAIITTRCPHSTTITATGGKQSQTTVVEQK